MIFKSLFKSAPKSKVSTDHLPPPHGFVDLTVAARGMRSVSIEEVSETGIVVGDVVGRAGEIGVFVYQNQFGKFRCAAKISDVKDGWTYFAAPSRIEAMGGGAQKRTSVRMDTLVPGFWRMAPGGKGVGDYMKGNIRDISRGGCALILDRQCKTGSMIEVKMALRSEAPPLCVLGEVMRCEQIPTSGKYSHGLRFHGLRPGEDQAILDFINRKLTDLRNRGLA